MFTPREPITVQGFTYKFGTRILIHKEDYISTLGLYPYATVTEKDRWMTICSIEELSDNYYGLFVLENDFLWVGDEVEAVRDPNHIPLWLPKQRQLPDI